jgi:hypothetical protein
MARSVRWVLILFAVMFFLSLSVYIAWQRWRENALLAFCKDVSVDISFADLLRAEKRHWIDNSYLVEALFKDYVDQAHSHELEFRSHIYDPPFACVISHDGRRVTSVQLLVTENW